MFISPGGKYMCVGGGCLHVVEGSLGYMLEGDVMKEEKFIQTFDFVFWHDSTQQDKVLQFTPSSIIL